MAQWIAWHSLEALLNESDTRDRNRYRVITIRHNTQLRASIYSITNDSPRLISPIARNILAQSIAGELELDLTSLRVSLVHQDVRTGADADAALLLTSICGLYPNEPVLTGS